MLNSTTTYFKFFQENNFHVQQRSPHARLQEYVEVFQGNLPLTLAKLADQILIVCGGLCNLLKPLAR